MKKRADGTFVSQDRPVLLVLGAFVFAAGFAIGAWRQYQGHASGAIVVVLIAAALGAILLAYALPSVTFIFDPARRLITWSSRSLFESRSGQVQFSQVRDVIVQSMRAEGGSFTYRLALMTDARTLPLSSEYSGGEKGVRKRAEEIRAILGI